MSDIDRINKFIIYNKKGIDCLNKHGLTMLMITCNSGSLDGVKLLVEKGANINYNGTTTPIIQAIKGKNLSIIEYLLKHPDIIINDNELTDNNIYMVAISESFDIFKFIYNIRPIALPIQILMTMLSRFIIKFDDIPNAIKFFFEHNFINDINQIGEIILIHQYWHIELIQYLLDNGYDQSDLLYKYIMYNCEKPCQLTLAIILDNFVIPHDNYWNDLLFYSLARVTDINLIKLLLDNGADINYINTHNQTPIMQAFGNHKNNIDIIKHLISLGADINVKDLHGNGILVTASNSYDSVNKINYIIDELDYVVDSLDISLVNINNITYSQLSKMIQNLDLSDITKFNIYYTIDNSELDYQTIQKIRILVSKGLDINGTNFNGDTLFFQIVKSVSFVLIAEIYDPDKLIDTTLKILQELIELGANVNKFDLSGKTVFAYLKNPLYAKLKSYLMSFKAPEQTYTPEQILEANQRYNQPDKCICCYESVELMTAMPCGHKCICRECYEQIENSKCIYCTQIATFH